MNAYRIPLPHQFQQRTLPELLRHRFATHANRLALIASAADGVERRITYAQLGWHAEKFACGLEALGARRGDKVGILAENEVGYEATVTLVACLLAGFVAVPINARFSREEIDHAVDLAQIRVLVYDTRHAEELGDIAGRFPALETLIAIGRKGERPAARTWDEVSVRPAAGAAEWPLPGEDEISEILFTSGSTARPKAAMLSTGSGVYAAFGFADALGLREGDIYQSFFPFFTTAGIRCVLLPAWFAGATAILDPKLDIEAIMRRIEEERTTAYVGVPSFYIFLLEAYDPARYDLSSLRVLDAGGAALLPEITTRLIKTFPGVDIRQTYGGTEGGPSGTVLKGNDALRKIGSAGTCWPHTELRIVDEDDNDLPTGQAGEIVLRSPGIFTGYYRNEEASRDTLREGWMHSGDIGYLDEEGYLYVVDRKKDLVIRGGHNIGTLEVETVLLRHPGVSEVSVIGVPHPKLGEDLLAVIKTTDGVDIPVEELRAFCAGKLADFKTPRKFAFVHDFPRTGMGKILKPELRSLYRNFDAGGST